MKAVEAIEAATATARTTCLINENVTINYAAPRRNETKRNETKQASFGSLKTSCSGVTLREKLDLPSIRSVVNYLAMLLTFATR